MIKNSFVCILYIIFLGLFLPGIYAKDGVRSSLVVPVSKKDKVLQARDFKALNRNLKRGVALIDDVRERLSVSSENVSWYVSNAILQALDIPLAVENARTNKKCTVHSDRIAHIILDDFSIISIVSANELKKYLKKINKYKTLFNSHLISIDCWVDGLMVLHQKGDERSSTDRVIISIKITSYNNSLAKIFTQLDRLIEENIGIPKVSKSFHIPLASFSNIDRNKALEIISELKDVKSSCLFNKNRFKIRQFYFKQLFPQRCILEPLNIQNFSRV